MTRNFDTVVLGGDTDALVAAIELARSGSKVLLLTADSELGGIARQIEFAPGFRAAPFGRDLGWIPPEVLSLAGITALPQVASSPALLAFGEGAPLPLSRSVTDTAAALQPRSAADAQKWPEFCRRLAAMSGFLEGLYRHPPPRIDSRTVADTLAALQIGRRFRSLRRAGMDELLRTIPMAVADLLDDWFESLPLKGALSALAVRDLCQGPMAGGTAFAFLHQLVGAPAGSVSERTVVAEGISALVGPLALRAKSLGVTIETRAPVAELTVTDDFISAVCLASGEVARCREVISAIDPYQTLLKLLDPVHLEVETIRSIRNIRYRGVTSMVLLALDRLPKLPDLCGAPTGVFLFTPTIGAVERAYDAVKYGSMSDRPIVEMHFPSVANPALAPVGKHVAVLRVQYTPYALAGEGWDIASRDSIGARAISVVEEHLPDFGSCVSAGRVLAPPELETTFGLREAAPLRGELALDQILFMRPFPEGSRYRTPLRGLFVCGSGSHPGPGITGISGRLAARSVLAWRKQR